MNEGTNEPTGSDNNNEQQLLVVSAQKQIKVERL